MLVTTQTTLALRCPQCGKLDLYALSRFSCSGKNTCKISCECGADLLSISRNSKGNFSIQLECAICESKHVLTYQSRELWNSDVLALKCESTGVEIGFIGKKEAVRESVKRVDRSLRDIAEELGYDKYFVNADIMYQVLELLRKMLSNHQISCDCGGGQPEVEVYPDRIELLCPCCGATGIIFAETVKDLQGVNDLGEVHLETHSYQYLDRKRPKKKTRIKK